MSSERNREAWQLFVEATRLDELGRPRGAKSKFEEALNRGSKDHELRWRCRYGIARAQIWSPGRAAALPELIGLTKRRDLTTEDRIKVMRDFAELVRILGRYPRARLELDDVERLQERSRSSEIERLATETIWARLRSDMREHGNAMKLAETILGELTDLAASSRIEDERTVSRVEAEHAIWTARILSRAGNSGDALGILHQYSLKINNHAGQIYRQIAGIVQELTHDPLDMEREIRYQSERMYENS